MNLFGLDQIFSFHEYLVMGLVLLRCFGFIFSWPLLGEQTVPVQIKVLLSLLLAFLLFPTVEIPPQSQWFDTWFVYLMIKEVLIGVFIGFLCRLFFLVFQISGEVISISMSLSSAQMFNPLLNTSTNVIAQFHYALAGLVFLLINGHHLFLKALVDSFQIVKIERTVPRVSGLQEFISVSSEIILLGIKLAAPVMVAVLIANLVMGLIGRAVPQINVLITSIPVTIAIGFIVLFITLPVFYQHVTEFVGIAHLNIFRVLAKI